MMSENFRRSLSVVALAMIAGLSAALPGVANADDASAGSKIFQEKCSACHTIGNGALVGPDLKGITEKEPREWLQQWIAGPEAMVAKKDPTALSLLHQFHDVQMPNPELTSAEINDVLAFLANPGAAGTTATSAPALQGDPQMGKDLFTGVVRFANGGPPCMACHSVSGIGALGGGQLGPDLTEVLARYGGATALNAFIAGTPTPTMKAVWSQHPLADQERANVVTFLGQAEVSQRPAEAIWQIAGVAVLGFVILLAIGAWNWRGRLRFGVRRPMVAKPTTGHSDPRNGGWFTGTYHPGWKDRFESKR
jgi:cytochrome c2